MAAPGERTCRMCISADKVSSCWSLLCVNVGLVRTPAQPEHRAPRSQAGTLPHSQDFKEQPSLNLVISHLHLCINPIHDAHVLFIIKALQNPPAC